MTRLIDAEHLIDCMELPRVIYWDYFRNEYVLNKDEIAPPERYMETFSSGSDLFIERWEVTENENGNRLNISFVSDLYKDIREVGRTRRYHFKKNNCKPVQMISICIPKQLFEEYCSDLMRKEE